MDGPRPLSEPHAAETVAVWSGPLEPSRLLVWTRRWRTPADERLAEAVGGGEVEAMPIEPPVRWAAAVHPDHPQQATRLVWAEEVNPAAFVSAPPGVAHAEMVVGLETLLPPPESGDSAGAPAGDPWRAWLEMARTLETIGGIGPILDPITGRWFERETVETWLGGDADPLPEEVLWSVRATRREGGRGVWLSTDGLARMGRPELEMLEVPESLADAAAALLDGLAALACESPPPRDREWKVGPELTVVVRTPRDVLETTDDRSAGSLPHRGGRMPEVHGGTAESVVVCATEPRGRYRRIWTAPLEVLEAVAGGAAMHRTERAATRQRRLAQRHLRLVDLSLDASVGRAREDSNEGRVLVAGGGDSGRTIWGELLERIGDRWSVQPLDLSGRPAAGEPETLIARGEVVDWRVELDGVVHGPEDAGRLAERLAGDAPRTEHRGRGDST